MHEYTAYMIRHDHTWSYMIIHDYTWSYMIIHVLSESCPSVLWWNANLPHINRWQLIGSAATTGDEKHWYVQGLRERQRLWSAPDTCESFEFSWSCSWTYTVEIVGFHGCKLCWHLIRQVWTRYSWAHCSSVAGFSTRTRTRGCVGEPCDPHSSIIMYNHQALLDSCRTWWKTGCGGPTQISDRFAFLLI